MAGREKFLPVAIQCFLDQDYPSKELIIVADYLAWDVRIVPLDKRIRMMICPGLEKSVLGTKRNLACAAARGEFVVHFDDDDRSAPGRISDQVKRLQESGKAVTGYSTILVHETRTVLRWDENGEHPTSGWWRLTNPDGEAAGTSLCYRRDWWRDHPFLPVNTCEDNEFWREAVRLDAAIAVDGRDFVCATNHAGNISARLVGAGAAWTEIPARNVKAVSDLLP